MKAFGAEEVPELLSNSSYALGTIVFYTCWTSLGANMLLFSGAMSRIPLEVLESSRLDGCYAFKELVYIIFPMVFPTISTLIVFTCTGLFNSSGRFCCLRRACTGRLHFILDLRAGDT